MSEARPGCRHWTCQTNGLQLPSSESSPPLLVVSGPRPRPSWLLSPPPCLCCWSVASRRCFDALRCAGRYSSTFCVVEVPHLCGVPQSQLPQRTPGQTRQARGGRRGPPGGARAGPGAHCGVGPAWVLEIISNQKPSPMSCPAHRIGLTSLSRHKVGAYRPPEGHSSPEPESSSDWGFGDKKLQHPGWAHTTVGPRPGPRAPGRPPPPVARLPGLPGCPLRELELGNTTCPPCPQKGKVAVGAGDPSSS